METTTSRSLPRLVGAALTSIAVSATAVGLAPPARAAAPTDPLAAHQWALAKVKGSDAWATATGAGVKVAIVDSGVDEQHEDLQCAGKLEVALGSDVVNDGSGPDDVRGNGTHAAGIIGACTNNGIGIAGIAPGSTILPFQVMRSSGSATFTDVALGIRRAADAGAHVVHVSVTPSVGALSYVPGLFAEVEAAAEYAAAQGAVVVAPAGNDAMPLCESPALIDEVVCVGATDARDVKAWYGTFATKSNSASGLTVSAPGGNEHVLCGNYAESVLSLFPPELDSCVDGNSGYADRNGTHVAAAHVSGLAAVLYQQAGGLRSPLSRSQVIERLLWTADDLGAPGQDPLFGFGRINAMRAVTADQAPVFIEVDAQYVPGMYLHGFQCTARATGGMAVWTEVTRCYVDIMQDHVEAGPERREGNVATAGYPFGGFSLALYPVCWEAKAEFAAGRTLALTGCGTSRPVSLDVDGIGAAWIYANGFSCNARATGQVALATTIDECWTVDMDDRTRNAPGAFAPGNTAATAWAYTWLSGLFLRVCWSGSATFIDSTELTATGCGWDWPIE